MIIDAAISQKYVTHAIHFDHKYKNFAPYNTTDALGFRALGNCMTQFFCHLQIQFLFNLHTELDECEGDTERAELV